MASRNIADARGYVDGLTSTGDALKKEVEAGKKKFKGVELPGRKLGIVGLGAVGVKVANAARALDMTVAGFDPAMTIDNAWRLDSAVESALSIEALLHGAEFVSVHEPLLKAT